jgi:hypothetical protein
VGGGLERADNGRVRSFASATYYDHRFRTGPLTKSLGKIMRDWVEGAGHTLSFESTLTSSSWKWTSRGLAPLAGSAAINPSGAGAAKKGDRSMRNGLLGATTYPVGYTTATVFGWVRPDSGTWVHVARTFVSGAATATYINGALLVGSHQLSNTILMSGTSVQLKDQGSAAGYGFTEWDDIVMVPYTVPAEWFPFIYDFHATHSWPLLPFVTAEGDRIDGTITARAEVGSIDTVGHTVNGVWEPAGDAFDFVLMETP